jgi:hypothetical protein
MENKAPGGSGQGRRAVNLKCGSCFFYNRFSREYQAACRLILLQALIGPYFEPDLSLRLDGALIDLEALKGGPVHVGVVVHRVMADLARQRPDYLEGHHG